MKTINRLHKSLSILLILSLLMLFPSCQGESVPVYSDSSYQPAPNESGVVVIKQGETLNASFFMADSKNPESLDYMLWINDMRQDNYKSLNFDEDITIKKGYLETVGYGTHVRAVPCSGGMEFEVNVNNLPVGEHELLFCLCSLFNSRWGLGLVCSENSSVIRLMVIVEE